MAEALFGEGVGYLEYEAANEPRRQANDYAGLLLFAWYADAGLQGTCLLSDQRLLGTVPAAEQSDHATFAAK
ncbi:hypothetical protein [Hymenobacter edaphi]|uniref:hypothetical protein n=1 Tax=Hymenobacter edaphi TaxID=2211146 RepID=UPI001058095C|nr:hypothetical protein [Hymenobacter edaphi]